MSLTHLPIQLLRFRQDLFGLVIEVELILLTLSSLCTPLPLCCHRLDGCISTYIIYCGTDIHQCGNRGEHDSKVCRANHACFCSPTPIPADIPFCPYRLLDFLHGWRYVLMEELLGFS